MNKFLKELLSLIPILNKSRKVLLCLSAVVVFITTYMLILPAFTLGREAAEYMGGIDVPAAASEEEELTDDAATEESTDDAVTENNSQEDKDKSDSQASSAKDSSDDTPEADTKQDKGKTESDTSDSAAEYEEVNDEGAAGASSVDLGLAVVSTADESDLPDDIDGHAEVVKEKKEIKAAKKKVEKEIDDIDFSDFSCKIFDISLDNIREKDYKDGFDVEVTLPEDVTGTDYRLFHIHDGDVEELELTTVESEDKNADDDTISGFTFHTDGFSQFVLAYTVDFEYSVDGEVYSYSLDGGESILLSELADTLGVTNGTGFSDAAEFISHIDKVEFSDSALIKVIPVKGKGQNETGKAITDWELKSLKAFDTEETLTITMDNSDVITVKVTDAQGGGSISVSKVLDYQSGMNKVNGERIYFALVKDGEYVTDSNNKIVYKEMFMQGDTLNPSRVTFTGLEDGEYEVWEMHGDPNNGTLNRSYDGMLIANDTVQIDKIRVIANSNGQQNSNGLYNNNASIKNGSSESMTFRNTYKPASNITSFEANKVWMDRKEKVIQAPEDASIVFTLYKEVGGVTTSTGKTIVLNGVSDNDGELNPWQAVFKDLPKTENGQQIKYKVKETSGWPDYYVCKNKGKNLMGENEYLDTSGGTIYNRHLLATIQIQKHFDIQHNKYSDADWAEVIAKKQLSFELTNETTHETWYFTLDDTFTRDGQLFYLNVPDMQAGHYVLKEYRYKGLITDRKWDRGITIYERDINPGDNMDNPLFEMEVQNWYVAGNDEPEGAYIRALKVWDDLDDFDGIRPSSVTVRLHAKVNGNDYQLPDITNPVVLSEENDWNTGNIWYNLPIEDNEGHTIEYSVTEENVPDGYTCNTTVSDNGTDKSYTFTNTHRPEGAGSLKLRKIVNGPSGAAVPKTFYFTVKGTDGRYYTGHSVSGPDGHYTAIPISTTTGEGEDEIVVPAGTYTVSEIRDGIEVEGYTLTVSGEGDCTVEAGKTTTVTITNNYEELPKDSIRVQKKWQDKDGNPVSGEGKTANVQLKRYHYVADGDGAAESHTITVQFEFPTGWGSSDYKVYEITEKTISSSSADISWNSQGSFIDPEIGTLSGKDNDGNWHLTLNNIDGDQTITIRCNDLWAYNSSFHATISADGEKEVKYSLEKDNSFAPAAITLSGSDWSHNWSIGGTESSHAGFDYPATDDNGKDYLYYIEELDENGNVVSENGSVSSNVKLDSITYQPARIEDAGIKAGLVTVTNTVDDSEQTGSIKITKNVLYNGEPDAESEGRHFYIGIYSDEAGTQKVAEAHVVVGYHDGIADEDHRIDGTGTGWTVVENLPYGTYYIYEMDNNAAVRENGETGTMQDGNVYTISSPAEPVTIGAAQAAATVTNSREEYGSIEVEKIARTTRNGNSTNETTGTYHVGLFEVVTDSSTEPATETLRFAQYQSITAGGKIRFENLSPGKTYRVYELSEAITDSNKSSAVSKIIDADGKFGEYTVSYANNEQVLGRGDQKDKTGTVITNEKFETDYIIEKRWMRQGGEWDIDYGSRDGDTQTVYFRLYRTVDGETYPVGWDGKRINDEGNPAASVLELKYSDTMNALKTEAAAANNGNQNVTKGQVLHWTKMFESLPGTYDQYHAVECSKDGIKNYGDPVTGAAIDAYEFYQTCPELGPGEGDTFVATFAIKNDLVKAKNAKTWESTDESVRDKLWVRMQLKRNGEDYLAAKVAGKDAEWSAVWEDLPKADPATGVEYSYSVEEIGVYASKNDAENNENNLKDKFTITTDSTTFAGDTYTTPITNKLEDTDFEFTKIWKDSDGNDTTWQSDITITLYSLAGTKSTEVAKFTLTKDGGETGNYKWTASSSHDGKWTTFKLTGLPSLDKDGNSITYYVTEEQVAGYKTPEYYFLNTSSSDSDGDSQDTPAAKTSDKDKALNGDIIINRPDDSYELPHTGGIGTTIFYILGSVLLIGSTVYLVSRRRVSR